MTSSEIALREMEASAAVRVADVIRGHAESRPAVLALRHGERELTYAELHERSSRLANALLRLGVRDGDRVAYLGRSAPEVIELLAACSKIGAVIVPLNWRLSDRELVGVLSNAQAPLLIADTAYLQTAERLRVAADTELELRIVGADGRDAYEPWLAEHDAADPGGRGEPSDVI